MSLPIFRYHPDPVATGSVKPSGATCLCCNRQRQYIYASHVYCEEELDEALCPWCIFDGSAHAKFGAEFTDSAGIGGYSPRVPVPPSVVQEVAFRTPGFSGWQQERWLACCDDAAAFLGSAGRAELQRQGPEAIEAVRAETGLDGAEWQRYFEALHTDHGPTAYVFQCLHCQRFLAYSDTD